MDAIVVTDFNESKVAEIPKPIPSVDEVLIKVKRVQLSVTECGLYNGKQLAHREAVEKRINSGPARMFGHEFCGIVSEVGDDVQRFSKGDRVFAPGKIPCEECRMCDSGHKYLCKNKENIGYERPGALAEYFTAPTQPLEKVTSNISDAEVAAMQPFATSVVAMYDSEIELGDVVVVLGQGVMGSQCAQLARCMGAGHVIGTDVVQKKLNIAESHGIEPIDASSKNMIEHVKTITDGVGADVVVEAVGGNQDWITEGDDPISRGFECLRSGGTLIQVGHIAGDISMTARSLRKKNFNWVHPRVGNIALGPNNTSGTLALKFVAEGDINIKEQITHEFSGLRSFEKAVDVTLNKTQYDALGPAQLVL